MGKLYFFLKMNESVANVTFLKECLRCQENQPAMLCHTIETLRVLCCDGQIKTAVREVGIIEQLFLIVSSSVDADIVCVALSCLGDAVWDNYQNKLTLTHPHVFKRLYHLLYTHDKDANIALAAAYCCACVSLGNSKAHLLMRSSGCLHFFLNQLMSYNYTDCSSHIHEILVLLNTLGNTMNNPQNDVNQQECAILFPRIVNWLTCTEGMLEQKSLLSFVGLAVTHNFQNQSRLNNCGGINTLMGLLNKHLNFIKHTLDSVQPAIDIVACIDAAISQNEENCSLCGDEGLIGVLVELLRTPTLQTDQKVVILMCLAHATEMCGNNQKVLAQSKTFGIVISELIWVEDEEVQKSVHYIIKCCQPAMQKPPEQCKILNPYLKYNECDDMFHTTNMENYVSPATVDANQISSRLEHKTQTVDVHQRAVDQDMYKLDSLQYWQTWAGADHSQHTELNEYEKELSKVVQNGTGIVKETTECPGCDTSVRLNSRNFKIILQCSSCTCNYHKTCGTL